MPPCGVFTSALAHRPISRAYARPAVYVSVPLVNGLITRDYATTQHGAFFPVISSSYSQ